MSVSKGRPEVVGRWPNDAMDFPILCPTGGRFGTVVLCTGQACIEEDRMRQRSLSARASRATTKLALPFLVALVLGTPVSLAQAEEPSAAAIRFYGEYLGMGVA